LIRTAFVKDKYFKKKSYMNVSVHRGKILREWQDGLFSSLPPELLALLNRPDPFVNPMGTMIPKMLEILFDQIFGEMDGDKIGAALEDYIKFWAVQDCPPSRAFVFLPRLRELLRAAAEKRDQNGEGEAELSVIEDRIIDILQRSFDMYMKCRDKIHTLRINEFKKRAFRVLENIQ
jgi:hypothetical protein